MTMRIAVAGLFDRFVPDFIRWFQKEIMPDAGFIGLGRLTFSELSGISWRSASLLSSSNAAKILEDVDTLVYFGMTPLPEKKISEGFFSDVALSMAVNIAAAARQRPNLRVILVTRAVHHTHVSLESCCDFFVQVAKIFERNECTIIRTEPVISEYDAVSVALFEHAQLNLKENAEQDWDAAVYPVRRKTFYQAVADAICGSSNERIHLQGDQALSYREWIQENQLAIPKRFLPGRIVQMRTALFPENRLRARFLEEMIAQSSEKCDPASPALRAEVRANAEDLLDEDIAGKSLLLEPENRLTSLVNQSSCYVQRVLTGPNRSVSEIADLLIAWIPRYFQRVVRVDELSQNRVMCRISVVPVLEFEKIVESSGRCRIIIRNAWAVSARQPASFVVTSTGRDDDPGVLLIIVEDIPKHHILLPTFRAMILAFGRYLKDYGCGE